jgi:hypothetical protein
VVDNRKLKLSDVAVLVDMPLARLRTMRARNQTAMWDAGVSEIAGEGAGRGWRDYSVTDVVALCCVLELAGRGLSIDVAANIIANCRQFIHDADHPRTASRTDIFIGRVWFIDGQAHVGGKFCDLMIDIERRVRDDIRNFDIGGGSSVLLVNTSNHYRRITEALKNASR